MDGLATEVSDMHMYSSTIDQPEMTCEEIKENRKAITCGVPTAVHDVAHTIVVGDRCSRNMTMTEVTN